MSLLFSTSSSSFSSFLFSRHTCGTVLGYSHANELHEAKMQACCLCSVAPPQSWQSGRGRTALAHTHVTHVFGGGEEKIGSAKWCTTNALILCADADVAFFTALGLRSDAALVWMDSGGVNEKVGNDSCCNVGRSLMRRRPRELNSGCGPFVLLYYFIDQIRI